MALYLKYRPTELEDVKGNIEIVSILEKMLNAPEEFPHAILLAGGTGCGKTTIGRIIANRLGCVGSDFIEVDAGQMRGIDTIREIRQNSSFRPAEGKCRVWLLDEFHKSTNDAQNAILKILEDTPKHVYFIICTTEPNKLISAVLGRLQRFDVKPLNESQMYGLLRKVVKEEGQSLSKEIYDQIILDSLGHSRNALQILEKVLNCPEDKRLEIAKQSAEQQNQVIDLCRALLRKAKWKEVNSILVGLKGVDPEEIRRAVLGYCQAILLKEENDMAAHIMENYIEPFYNSGFPGLTLATYSIIKL